MVKKKISKRELKHQARRHSIKEGIYASAKMSFGDRFIQPFAIAINTSSPLVALLSSISSFLGPLSQTISSRLFERHSRKKLVLKAVFLEFLMWLPFITIAILFSKGVITNLLPLLFLFTFSIYIIFANVAYPAWFSWMGDIVDEKHRGRWFSKRTLLMGFTAVVLAILASFFLDYFKKLDLTMEGFIILFSLALIARFVSWLTFKKQHEPKLKFQKKDYFSFWQFLKEAPKNNFGKFTIFRGLLAFTGAIFSSLVAVYLLRYLGFSYLIYMVILMSGTIFSLIILGFWGKFADKYGNYRVLVFTTIAIPIIPILWILSSSPIYLIFIPSLIGGIAWAGFGLGAGNFIYDNVSQQKRSWAISYYNMMWGIGFSLGAIVAALLIKFLTITIIEPIILIFLISALLRMIVVFWWLPKIKEIKKTTKLTSRGFKKSMIKEIRPTLIEEIHEIGSIKNYLKD